ncbi:hypothetical protein M0R45_008907 [Rubus argutus]|uniref:Uncharacterized protein n=1 Tax=Rubus argutus TaxID=59490 RepID=A0AAW1Y3E5_RUBAR
MPHLCSLCTQAITDAAAPSIVASQSSPCPAVLLCLLQPAAPSSLHNATTPSPPASHPCHKAPLLHPQILSAIPIITILFSLSSLPQISSSKQFTLNINRTPTPLPLFLPASPATQSLCRRAKLRSPPLLPPCFTDAAPNLSSPYQICPVRKLRHRRPKLTATPSRRRPSNQLRPCISAVFSPRAQPASPTAQTATTQLAYPCQIEGAQPSSPTLFPVAAASVQFTYTES